ncbi:MAG TPA: DoxX family protein [Actinomadura sp.]|nr:DoxX family protein [Actinomadura sp.]
MAPRGPRVSSPATTGRRALDIALWTAQVLLAAFLLIPRLAGLAALGLIGLMAGAVITHLTVLEPVFGVLPAGFAVLLALIARLRWPRTRALIDGFKR